MVARTQKPQHHQLFNSSFDKIEFDFDDLKSPTPQKATKKSVRFERHDHVYEIPHIDDLSDEEIDDVWMHPDDFKAIRRECQAIILIIEHDSDLIEGAELRGLEHHTSKQKKQAQAIQKLLYDTVERLQTYGDQSSTDVSDMLACMCQKISKRPEAFARQTAAEDEEEAKKV
ncbi:unnamed protein product [Cylindrotheca closterium]|uniref:Uncharacterized protein n=1 Tax=Cylindrotheca closterium TaxID=2856 RepID=A0AAD2JH44_9STRA|nr:unnamed protein product [Cylindrotheca closterium]